MLREFLFPIIIALAGLLFASGCLELNQQEFIKNRLECIDLASQSHALVPKCNSQGDCFSVVEKRLFNFSLSRFDFDTRQELFHYKNHVARAWLYYNRAVKNVERIRSICEKNQSFEELPGLLNELNNNIATAFIEADNANSLSIKILLLERDSLEKMDLNEVKEEPLYDVFIEINNNLNQFYSTESFENSESYAAIMRHNTEKFNSLSEKKGFSRITLKELSVQDLFSDVSRRGKEALLEKEKKRGFFVPFLSDYFDFLNSFLWKTSKLNESIAAFRSFPSFEFMSVFSDLAGENNSAIERFSALLRKDSESKNALFEKISLMESDIDKRIDIVYKKASAFSFEEFSESSTLPLGTSETTLSLKELSFDSLKSASSELLLFVGLLQKELLKEKNSSEPAGKKLAMLKRIDSQLSQTEESVDFISSKLVNEWLLLCEEQISLMEKNLQSSSFAVGNDENSAELNALKQQLLFVIDGFWSEETAKGRLLKCFTAIEKSKELFAFLKDHKAYEEGKKLEEFRKKANAEFIERVFSECIEMLSALKKLSYSESKTLQLEKETNSLKAFFSNGKLKVLESMEEVKEIQHRVLQLNTIERGELKNAFTAFFSSNYSIEEIPESPPELGKPYISRIKVAIKNNFFHLREPIEFRIPWQSNESEIEVKFRTGNIESIKNTANNLVVKLSSVPLGTTSFEFYSKKEIPFSVQEKLLSASSQEALIEKIIHLNTKLPKIKAVIGIEDFSLEIGQIRIIASGQSIPFALEGKNVSFFVENHEEEIKIYYSLKQPISISIKPVTTEKSDLNQLLWHYSVLIKNELCFKIPIAEIILPLNMPTNIEELTLKKANGKKLNVEISSGKALFSISGINPFEEIPLFLNAKYKSSTPKEFSKTKNSMENDKNPYLERFTESKERAESMLEELNTASNTATLLPSEMRKELTEKKKSVERLYNAGLLRYESGDINQAIELMQQAMHYIDSNMQSFNKKAFGLMDSLSESIEKNYFQALDLNASDKLIEFKREKMLSLKEEASRIISRGNISKAVEKISEFIECSTDLNAILHEAIIKAKAKTKPKTENKYATGIITKNHMPKDAQTGIFGLSTENSLVPLLVIALMAIALLIKQKRFFNRKKAIRMKKVIRVRSV